MIKVVIMIIKVLKVKVIQLDGKQKDPPIDATESCRSDILDLCICVFMYL